MRYCIIFCGVLLVCTACGGGRENNTYTQNYAPYQTQSQQPVQQPAAQPAQDYTRDVYQPFATDNVIPHYPADNDEEFFPFYYYDD